MKKTGIGQRLRVWRKRKNMKAIELAKIIGLSQGSLSEIETGKNEPSARTIVKLLTLTDINWRWVLIGERGKTPAGSEPNKTKVTTLYLKPGSEYIIKHAD